MKIVGISGSPRKNGNTSYLVKEALKAAEEKGFKTEFISLSGLELNPCIACDMCKKEDSCIIVDDINEIMEKIEAADGLILGSPVYFGGVSAQTKTIIDRSRPLRSGFKLKYKVAAAISSGASRNGGQETTIRQIHDFFLIQSMIVVGDSEPSAHYGGTGQGKSPEDTKTDAFGIETSRNTGKRVAEVLNMLKRQ
ncbi:NADPH-dependent FMN reductase [Methanococcus vannielii SB]|uniref:NADPH-dependent FMN reductase n=1 Tax=Methanococcus vannielii (strain ATCC 35089 / DSM 1224 / JCM 13029 / OCM 148 / SB) TaxID=406327 RepID=A6UN53_METVS|nr:flavodoxin family protein [Methanococcus vannielii]ABR53925.1 NADPH-dependent FMN reductase [Methanococcus vannielii SB]